MRCTGGGGGGGGSLDLDSWGREACLVMASGFGSWVLMVELVKMYVRGSRCRGKSCNLYSVGPPAVLIRLLWIAHAHVHVIKYFLPFSVFS